MVLCVVMQSAVTPWDDRRPLAKSVDLLVEEALGDLRNEVNLPDFKFRGGIHFRSWSRRLVEFEGRGIGVMVGLANPTNRKLSAYSPRLDRDASGYEAIAETRASLTPGATPARRVLLRRGSSRVLSFSWYEPEPNLFVEFVRHALALDRSPFARESAAVAIRLTTRVHHDEKDADAEARLRRFYATIAPVISTLRAPAASLEHASVSSLIR